MIARFLKKKALHCLMHTLFFWARQPSRHLNTYVQFEILFSLLKYLPITIGYLNCIKSPTIYSKLDRVRMYNKFEDSSYILTKEFRIKGP